MPRITFKFADMEYTGKVHGLTEAAKNYETLNSILDIDLRNDTVRTQGSLSRNLRRVSDCSLKEAASTAYAEVLCASYHTWAVRTAVSAGMCALPTREQLLVTLNETVESAEKEMRRYINASLPIIQYIDELYISRSISLDW